MERKGSVTVSLAPCPPPVATRAAATLGVLGGLALATGLLVYLADRDPARAALIPAVAALAGSHLFGAIGQWLPSFVHPFAFSLFTAAVRPLHMRSIYRPCLLWWAVNVAFEAAQLPPSNAAIAEGMQSMFGQAWLPALLSSFFLSGTFDVGDLVAATAGALAAAGVLYVVHRPEVKDGH